MMPFLSWIALLLLVLSCGGLLLARRRGWRVVWLFVLYLPFAWLLTQVWPPLMAVLRLFTGWIVVASIGIALQSAHGGESRDVPFGPDTPFFYLQNLILVIAIGIGATRPLSSFLNAPAPLVIASVTLLGSGILLFGFNAAAFPYLLGILLFVNGFEMLYAMVESSAFLLFLLTALNLLAGLAMAYHLAEPTTQGDEL